MERPALRRINVIGTSAAGKSTFAARLATVLRIPHVELDALHWEPGWIEVSSEVFRNRVAASTNGEAWIVDGNYSKARDILWPRVDTLIWLDYPFPLVLWRATWRTLVRILRKDACCNGNRESLRRALSRDSLILWVIRTHVRRRSEFRELLRSLGTNGPSVVILRTPTAAARWLGEVTQARSVHVGDVVSQPSGI